MRIIGTVNLNYKEGLEQYKGQIIGFTRHGFAAYPNNCGLNALDSCDCCGQIIHSQLSDADFCPVCAVLLGIVNEEIAKELCKEKYLDQFNEIEKDAEYGKYLTGIAEGFKKGVQFALKNARSILESNIMYY